MFAGIQAVLFDLDGTLIDSAPDLGAAADKMRTDRGMPSLPLSHYRHMAGAGARGMEYNPLTRHYWLSANTSVNYMLATQKA